MRRSIPWMLAGLFALLWISSAYRLSLMQAPLADVAQSIEEIQTNRAAEKRATAEHVVRALRLLRLDHVDAAIAELEALLPGLSYSLELAGNEDTKEQSDLLGAYLAEFPPAELPSDHILSGVKILPVYESGEMTGLSLQRVEPGSAFAASGFLPGDTIIRVGSLELTSPGAVADALKALSTEGQSPAVSFLRQGMEQTVTWRGAR